MFFPKPQENKIKPTLYPDPFLIQKFQRDSDSKDPNVHNACLLKYFPKYYRNLEISLTAHPQSVQHKVRLVKVIHHFHCPDIDKFPEDKTLKRLLRTCRKTLKSLPTYQNYSSRHLQRRNLSLYFPHITSRDLSYNQCFKGDHHLGVLTRSVEKYFYRSYGYFWDGNRLVKKLKITNQDLYYWVMLKKLGESKRFLRSLKTLQLCVSGFRERSMVRRSLGEFLKNKEVLEYVTHLKFGDSEEIACFWQLMESLINSCERLSFLSLPIGLPKEQSIGFSLNFCRLENLQVLELKVNSLATFISGVELPQSLRKITFQVTNYQSICDLLDTFSGEDGSSRFSLDRYKTQQTFFDIWKKLQNLKVLKLILPVFAKVDNIFKSLVVPLLKAIPQLETFIYKWSRYYFDQTSLQLDLDVLLEGIEPLRSLKKLKILPDSNEVESTLTVIYNPQRVYFLPHVTSIKISAGISEDFNLKKFLNTLFFNVKLKAPDMNKIIKLSSLRISCLKQFIKALQILHVVSQLKTVRFEMKIDIFEQTLSALMENFRYPIYIPKNLLLTVGVKLIGSIIPLYLIEEKVQHLRMVFGQFSLTISYQEVKVTPQGYVYYSRFKTLFSNQIIKGGSVE